MQAAELVELLFGLYVPAGQAVWEVEAVAGT
jgi:hypothetical protein